MNQRLTVYRRMAAVRTDAELDRLMDEVRDRYGTSAGFGAEIWPNTPRSGCMADRIGVESIDREGQTVVLKFRPEAKLDPQWLFRVVQQRGDVILIPPATLKLDLRGRAGGEPAGRRRRPRPAGQGESGKAKGAIRSRRDPGGRRAPGPER